MHAVLPFADGAGRSRRTVGDGVPAKYRPAGTTAAAGNHRYSPTRVAVAERCSGGEEPARLEHVAHWLEDRIPAR